MTDLADFSAPSATPTLLPDINDASAGASPASGSRILQEDGLSAILLEIGTDKILMEA